MGSRSGHKKGGYIYTPGLKKIVYTENRGGIKIIKTRYKFLKQRRSKNKQRLYSGYYIHKQKKQG